MVVVEVVDPFHPLLLIVAQLGLHARGAQLLRRQVVEALVEFAVVLKGLPFELLLQQLLYLGQVEERHLHPVALLHLAEDALQAVYVPLVDQSPLAVGQCDVFLLAILLQEFLQRHFLAVEADGGRAFQEVDARRQIQVHLRRYGLHLVITQPLGTHQLVVAHQLGHGAEQKGAGNVLRNDEQAVLVPHVLGRRARGGIADNGFPQLALVLPGVGVDDAAQQHLVLHGQRGYAGQVEAVGKVGIVAGQGVCQPQVEGQVGVHLLNDDGGHGLHRLLAVDELIVIVVEADVVDVGIQHRQVLFQQRLRKRLAKKVQPLVVLA